MIITCEHCGVKVEKRNRFPAPRFCNVTCSMRWQVAHGRKTPRMTGKRHSAATKRKMSTSMARRMKERPDTLRAWKTMKGWYKGFFFRSSYEYLFLKQLESQGLIVGQDVILEPFQIPYTWKGERRTYTPDFFVRSQSIVYEIKADHAVADPITQAKKTAAELVLGVQGITYRIVTGADLKTPPSGKLKMMLQEDPCVFLLEKSPEGDTLDLLFQEQRRFMELLQRERGFPTFPVDLDAKGGQKLLKDVSHDCMHELFEAIHLLKNSKLHRKTEVDGFDRESFVEELVDALHFFVELCICAGITPDELYRAYMKKGTVNFGRILSGY